MNGRGETARCQYNGLGYRTGKTEGRSRPETIKQMEENQRSQIYLWDGNAAGFYDEGEESPQYYLQDELGSPLRIEGEDGRLRESCGYDEFGCDLYGNQGKVQPFGYTGYQHDTVAGTYFAQAREYERESGRFLSQDLIAGFADMPFSMNRYTYCFNNGLAFVDMDGAWPSWNDIGNSIKNIGEEVSRTVKDTVKAAGKAMSSVPWKQVGIIAVSGFAVIGATALTVSMAPIVATAIIGATTGVAAAVSARAVTDIVSGQDSSWRDYVADGVGGAIAGAVCAVAPATSVFATPVAYGVISGGTGSLMGSVLKKESLIETFLHFGVNVFLGGTFGAIGGKIAKRLSETSLANLLRKLNVSGFENMFKGGPRGRQAMERIITTFLAYKSPSALYKMITQELTDVINNIFDNICNS